MSIDERAALGELVEAYHENPEMHGVNMASERLKRGEPLEWPNIVALNWAICSLLGSAQSIVEIGAGTGAFAEFASVDPNRKLTCFEFDDFARQHAISRCSRLSRGNVEFHKDYAEHLIPPYDTLVSVEVIEHVADVAGFLRFCVAQAPRAIITTPNRRVLRGPDHIGPPPYLPHVREFAPGEIYWLLRQHYLRVHLFYQPDVYVPWLAPMTLATEGTPIVALCEGVL